MCCISKFESFCFLDGDDLVFKGIADSLLSMISSCDFYVLYTSRFVLLYKSSPFK